LSDECYQNFLIFSVSMRILLSTHHQQYVNYGKKLLDYFVKTFEQLYGSFLISFNVHEHLKEDYKKYGPFDNCSTFQF